MGRISSRNEIRSEPILVWTIKSDSLNPELLLKMNNFTTNFTGISNQGADTTGRGLKEPGSFFPGPFLSLDSTLWSTVGELCD